VRQWLAAHGNSKPAILPDEFTGRLSGLARLGIFIANINTPREDEVFRTLVLARHVANLDGSSRSPISLAWNVKHSSIVPIKVSKTPLSRRTQ
jgi:hypothetical protein